MHSLRNLLHRTTRAGGLPKNATDTFLTSNENGEDIVSDAEMNRTRSTIEEGPVFTSKRRKECYSFTLPILRNVKTKDDMFCFLFISFITISLFIAFFLGLMNMDSGTDLESDSHLKDLSAFLHPKHDSEQIEYIGETEPYPTISISHYSNELEVPDHVYEHCRPITDEELLYGRTIKGHLIPELLLRMCKLVHDETGCLEKEGSIVPKLLNNTMKTDNFCLITYKDKSGICHHYFNPNIRAVGNPPSEKELTISSRHFTYLGPHSILLPKQILLTYQPVTRSSESEENELKHLERQLGKEDLWMPFLPNKVTEGISETRAFHIAHAYHLLTGKYPPVLDIRRIVHEQDTDDNPKTQKNTPTSDIEMTKTIPDRETHQSEL